jgi:hypothetical protein
LFPVWAKELAMLQEALEYLFTPCPRVWRKLGYLSEQIAIDVRFRRNRDAWKEHLDASKTFITEAIGRCAKHDTALLLGAGLQHDLPMEALADSFGHVVLADLVHRRKWQRAAHSYGGDVSSLEFDVSGVLHELWMRGTAPSAEEWVGLLERAPLSLPPEMKEEPDLVVSANLCAQLMFLPLDWLSSRRSFTEEEEGVIHAASARRHLDWLRARSGLKVLITETRRLRKDPEGRLLSSEKVPGLESLPAPAKTWLWKLAPIPELSRRYGVEREIGAWIL